VTICTSIIVAAEIRFGAEKSGSNKLGDQVDLILSAIEILPLESPADREYGKLRHYLARNGTPIGPNDMLIAAQALCAGLIVVTANTGEFSRVPGLNVENWLSE
jgi:tRNA(fMet)-specific endonuclease VapC